MLGLLCTASLHIFCDLNQSGTYSNKGSSMHTTSSYSSWDPGTYFSMRNKTVQTPSMIYQNMLLNKSIMIFIHAPALGKCQIFLYPVTRYNKAHVYAHNFSVSFFSFSGTHQSHHIDGCQATRINSFFIETF